jgi:hypothetical protein
MKKNATIMIRKILLGLILSLLFDNHLFCQKMIDVKYEKDNFGDYIFYGINNDYCNYTLEITFNLLTNLQSTTFLPYKDIIRPGSNYLFKLTKVNSREKPSFDYKFIYHKGCYNNKVDQDFVYLLPIASNKESKIFKINYIGSKYLGEVEPKDWFGVGFRMQYGDTVYAARRGIVTEIRDTAKQTGSNLSYSKSENFIEVYHSDCTFGKYEAIKDSGALVKLGERVEAGQPIGLAGGDKYRTGPHIRFYVYYHFDQQVKKINGDETDRIRHWAYVPLVFWTKDNKNTKLVYGNTYVSEHPDSLIIQEMSKREIKKWRKNKK